MLDFDAQRAQNDEASISTECVSTDKNVDCDPKEKVDLSTQMNSEEKTSCNSDRVRSTICIDEINHLTEKERIELRRQKFGKCEQLSEIEKRLARSKRFGVTSEEEKKKIRRARFGMVSETDKIRNRQERFGIMPRKIDPDHDKKIQARKLRFGLK